MIDIEEFEFSYTEGKKSEPNVHGFKATRKDGLNVTGEITIKHDLNGSGLTLQISGWTYCIQSHGGTEEYPRDTGFIVAKAAAEKFYTHKNFLLDIDFNDKKTSLSRGTHVGEKTGIV